MVALAVVLWSTPAPEGPDTVVHVAPSVQATRVPSVLRQGAALPPQAVSAVDILEDGRVAVSTMAFRHDRNFWLLSSDGVPLWGRQVAPWAPFQVASAAGGGAFGAGMAYSRVTGPQPTISLFADESAAETEVVDSLGAAGWLRYGSGDWRTGWIPSLIGDLLVRAGDSVVTVRGHDGGIRVGRDGRAAKSAFPHVRPYRMAASPDGSALAFGFIVPGEAAAGALPSSRSLLSVHETASLEERWTCAPAGDRPELPQLPDPVREFPEIAQAFGVESGPPIPCRVAASVSPTARASRVAVAEYGGWIVLRKGPVTGRWNPPYSAIPFVPRQRGTLRLLEAPGKEVASVSFPDEGLLEVRADPSGRIVWAFPASWFARGMAGAAWLPADPEARRVHTFDVAAARWERAWQFPDAVADLALHPDGERAWVSCWDGNLYWIHRDGRAATRVEVGAPARLSWSPGGSFAVAGTEAGEVIRLDTAGEAVRRTRLPVTAPRPLPEPLKPVFEGVPVWAVGRVGPEHAYVGDTWLVKAGAGGFLIDAGGSSAISLTLEKIRAAGVDPRAVRHLLHTHSHGDHAGAAYLWRAMGLRIVAPESAALATTWLMPTVSDYGVWVPRPVDVPLPVKRVGDETEITVEGLTIRAVFVPGHSYDSVIYLAELGGKRVAFTGDIGFKGQDILHRSWGDAEKAAAVTEVVRTKVLGFGPDIVFTGHDAHPDGTAFLEELVAQSLESIRKARSR
jgi:glyoxylase-like metal-dependent hydrolase (beta-lactamase superfamily II)